MPAGALGTMKKAADGGMVVRGDTPTQPQAEPERRVSYHTAPAYLVSRTHRLSGWTCEASNEASN